MFRHGLILALFVCFGVVQAAEKQKSPFNDEDDWPRSEGSTSSVEGQIFKDCPDCPEMAIIPAGSFEMGSEKYGPVHRVTVKTFAIGRTEVTKSQWQAVMGRKAGNNENCGNECPVLATWSDVKEFVRRLSQKTAKTYRLPSEAEWEYACRAGGRQQYCGSDDIDSVARTPPLNFFYMTDINPVARKQPNAWGLYDMSGNAWEWVEDCWHIDYNGAPSDGSIWADRCSDAVKSVARGGGWANFNPVRYRADLRSFGNRDKEELGLRVVRMFP